MKHARPDYDHIQDPYGRIPADEPVFILRAQDDLAVDLVRTWANLNEARGGDHRMTQSARAHADLMEAWPKKKRADLPDSPT